MSHPQTGTSALSFSFPTHALRVEMIDGEAWFVASDVCEALGLDDTSKACSRLDDDEKLTRTMFISGQNREVLIINESGLYSLILTSRKPEAKKFKKWVTSEVLPAIRKTGRYEQAAPTRATAPALPAQATELLGCHVAELTAQVTQLLRQVGSLSRKVITTQTQLVKAQARTLALVDGRMSGTEATATIIRMEREGAPRAAIMAATGRTSNHVRQVVFRARASGELPAQAATPSAQAALFEGA